MRKSDLNNALLPLNPQPCIHFRAGSHPESASVLGEDSLGVSKASTTITQCTCKLSTTTALIQTTLQAECYSLLHECLPSRFGRVVPPACPLRAGWCLYGSNSAFRAFASAMTSLIKPGQCTAAGVPANKPPAYLLEGTGRVALTSRAIGVSFSGFYSGVGRGGAWGGVTKARRSAARPCEALPMPCPCPAPGRHTAPRGSAPCRLGPASVVLRGARQCEAKQPSVLSERGGAWRGGAGGRGLQSAVGPDNANNEAPVVRSPLLAHPESPSPLRSLPIYAAWSPLGKQTAVFF